MGSVLGILGPERMDRRLMLVALARLRLHELRPRFQAEPAEALPVLGPAIDQERGLGPDEQILHAREVVRVGAPFRLLVQRTVDPQPSVCRRRITHHEANRDEAGAAISLRRGEGRAPRVGKECHGRGTDGRFHRH